MTISASNWLSADWWQFLPLTGAAGSPCCCCCGCCWTGWQPCRQLWYRTKSPSLQLSVVWSSQQQPSSVCLLRLPALSNVSCTWIIQNYIGHQIFLNVFLFLYYYTVLSSCSIRPAHVGFCRLSFALYQKKIKKLKITVPVLCNSKNLHYRLFLFSGFFCCCLFLWFSSLLVFVSGLKACNSAIWSWKPKTVKADCLWAKSLSPDCLAPSYRSIITGVVEPRQEGSPYQKDISLAGWFPPWSCKLYPLLPTKGWL